MNLRNLKKFSCVAGLVFLTACTNSYTSNQPVVTTQTTEPIVTRNYAPLRVFAGCPAPIANGESRVVKSYGVGTCGFPLRDNTDRFWINMTDFWVPIPSGQSLRCSPHRFASLNPGRATTGQQVFVDSLSGLLRSALPAGCSSPRYRVGTPLRAF